MPAVHIFSSKKEAALGWGRPDGRDVLSYKPLITALHGGDRRLTESTVSPRGFLADALFALLVLHPLKLLSTPRSAFYGHEALLSTGDIASEGYYQISFKRQVCSLCISSIFNIEFNIKKHPQVATRSGGAMSIHRLNPIIPVRSQKTDRTMTAKSEYRYQINLKTVWLSLLFPLILS